MFSTWRFGLAKPERTASTFSSVKASLITPPFILRARRVATMTTASGGCWQKFGVLISRNSQHQGLHQNYFSNSIVSQAEGLCLLPKQSWSTHEQYWQKDHRVQRQVCTVNCLNQVRFDIFQINAKAPYL